MNKDAKLINLNEWEKFGGGFTADSFYHKTDDSVMMKLYAEFMPPIEGYNELRCAEEVLNLRIPTAKAIEYVTDGHRYGAVFERIKNKKSIARLLADDPDNLDYYAKVFAEQSKLLHQKKCDSDFFGSVADRFIKQINAAEFVPKEFRDMAISIIENTPACDTCVHGDYHIGNMLMVDDRALWIDLGDFSYGNPLFDLGMLYFSAFASSEDITMDLFHITSATYQKFFNKFAEYYFDKDVDVKAMLEPYRFLTTVRYCAKIGFLHDDLYKEMCEYKNR